MLRYVDDELRQAAEVSFKVNQAQCYIHRGHQVWIVDLTVGAGTWETNGWAFVDPTYTELRFEQVPTMEPPGFLSGRYFRQGLDNSSLALLINRPTEDGLTELESRIKRFIDRCFFCIRSVTDIAAGVNYTSAVAYRYNTTKIPILKRDKNI